MYLFFLGSMINNNNTETAGINLASLFDNYKSPGLAIDPFKLYDGESTTDSGNNKRKSNSWVFFSLMVHFSTFHVKNAETLDNPKPLTRYKYVVLDDESASGETGSIDSKSYRSSNSGKEKKISVTKKGVIKVKVC